VPETVSIRDRILDAAEALMVRHGFSATTVDAVLGDAKASKGAFFHHFPSKVDLGRALVRRYAEADLAGLDASMAHAEASSGDPAEQLVAFLGYWVRAAQGILETQPGCLFIGFIYEQGIDDEETDRILRDAVECWRRRIAEKLEQAATTRPRLATIDLDALADHVFTTFEGGFLLAGATGDDQALSRQLDVLRRLVAQVLEVSIDDD
jgi:TetR/AcrR family transcriptional regulator, transcriptional repressor for nem operon